MLHSGIKCFLQGLVSQGTCEKFYRVATFAEMEQQDSGFSSKHINSSPFAKGSYKTHTYFIIQGSATPKCGFYM